MKHRQSSASVLSTQIHMSTSVGLHLTENDILNLQDAFLHSGFHYIQVKDFQQGRTFIESFLQSLALHADMGCLTMDGITLPHMVTDMKKYLAPHDSIVSESTIEEFLLDHYYDFIWIESSKKLISQSWYEAFRSKLSEFKVHHRIPIIVLTIEEK